MLEFVKRAWPYIGTVMTVLGLVDLTHQLIEWAQLIHLATMKYVAIREWIFEWMPLRVPTIWRNVIIMGAVTITTASIGYKRKTDNVLPQQVLLFATYIIWWPLGLLARAINNCELDASLRDRDERIEALWLRFEHYRDRAKPYIQRMILVCNSWNRKFKLFEEASIAINAIPRNSRLYNTAGCMAPIVMATCVAASVIVGKDTNFPIVMLLGFTFWGLSIGLALAWRWALFTLASFALLAIINEVYVAWLSNYAP
jgi:hypothetical protein